MQTETVKMILGTALFALFFTVTSYSQGPQNGQRGQEPPTVDEIFEQMDADEDGLLSKEELKGPLKNDFTKIDTDENGFLSKEEIEKAPKPKGPKGKQ